MKGEYTIMQIVSLIAMMVVAFILFTIMIMFFNVTPEVRYTPEVDPSVLYEGEIRDFCYDTKTMFVDSCILNNTVILREEGFFESVQLSKYRCKYELIYLTGFNMTINCSADWGKSCYIDREDRYYIGKCK